MRHCRFYHILCSRGESVLYEGRFQCGSRAGAVEVLRQKLGVKNLSGLRYTITEIPLDIIREVVESILLKKPLSEGDIHAYMPKELPAIPVRVSSPTPALSRAKRRLGAI